MDWVGDPELWAATSARPAGRPKPELPTGEAHTQAHTPGGTRRQAHTPRAARRQAHTPGAPAQARPVTSTPHRSIQGGDSGPSPRGWEAGVDVVPRAPAACPPGAPQAHLASRCGPFFSWGWPISRRSRVIQLCGSARAAVGTMPPGHGPPALLRALPHWSTATPEVGGTTLLAAPGLRPPRPIGAPPETAHLSVWCWHWA